ncbi:MAG: HD domain-containing protein [bacterium]
MKSLYVKDLSRGMQISGETFAVGEVKLAETKDKKPYYRVTLLDKTGSIPGQIWSDNISNVEKKALQSGRVVIINAGVEEFKGTLQLNISAVNSVDEVQLDEYMEASRFNLDELWDKMQTYVKAITDVQIQEFLAKVFADETVAQNLKVAPAAEYVHHSFRGGLLEHIVEMLDLCEPLKTYYPEANYDLVSAGIILHDIGKLLELKVNGAVVQRTKEGYLIGHLMKSYEFVLENARGILDEEHLLNLRHIILAHHGLLEYGSPVVPATIEAAIVHSIDATSTNVRIFQKILKKAAGKKNDEFAEWDNIIRARVYKSPLSNLE